MFCGVVEVVLSHVHSSAISRRIRYLVVVVVVVASVHVSKKDGLKL